MATGLSKDEQENLLKEIDILLKADKASQAVVLLRSIRTNESDFDIVNQLKEDARFRAACDAEQQLADLVKEAVSDTWRLHGESKAGCKVYVRNQSRDNTKLQFMAHKLLDVPLFSVIAVSRKKLHEYTILVNADMNPICMDKKAVNEHEDYVKFMPGLDTVEELLTPSSFRRSLRLSGVKPYPLNRTEVRVITLMIRVFLWQLENFLYI